VDTPRGKQAKRLGAYYTDWRVAEFLCNWALRHSSDKVIDPSFGGGVFLAAAAKRLGQLGGTAKTIYGVELDPSVHAQTSLELHGQCGTMPHHLLQANFFDIEPKHFSKLDVIVGNPPFIRYQGFAGEVREKALHQAKKQGVELTSLASSWAAFMIHATAFLKTGGRLAMVAPVELGHANYARPVLEYLLRSFGKVTLLMFNEPLFPKLSQDTLLVLAEDKGQRSSQIFLDYTQSIDALTNNAPIHLKNKETVTITDFFQDAYALSFYSLPLEARALYKRLTHSTHIKRLGDLAQVGIGYVTGANDFFHVNKVTAKRWKLGKSILSPAVYKAKAFQGLDFTLQDWQGAEQTSDAGYLLHIANKKNISASLQRYIDHGETQNVHQSYKCRVRSPWYCVPHVYQADAFLSYMSGVRAQLIANHAGAIAPNTLHIVRIKDKTIHADDLSVLWQNSLTQLSTEIEGHALGGGMLKLEPGEARAVIVPLPQKKITPAFRTKLDHLLRSGNTKEAIAFADKTILIKGIGLNSEEVTLLSTAANNLQRRRNKT
jgi:adenine-specific DNA-methyltransferase